MRHTLSAALLLTLALSQAITAQVVATSRTDANSLQAHAELMQKKSQGRIDVYFEGDSITRRWGTSDSEYADFLANWKQNFFGWNAADFGWGADTVQNILWRLEQGELSGVHPKVIVLLAGTNNVGDAVSADKRDAVINEVSSGIHQILALMQQQAPQATILLTALTPRNGKQGETTVMPVIEAINQKLAALADGKRIRFITLNAQLADASGKLREGMTVDGLHLSVRGYQIWADALKPHLRELLGPPAGQDHAPPPSSNPASRKQ